MTQDDVVSAAHVLARRARVVGRRDPRAAAVADGVDQQPDEPAHGPRRLVGVEAPGRDQALVGAHAPQGVEQRGRHLPLGLRPALGRGLDHRHQRSAPALVDRRERGVGRGAGRDGERRQVGEQVGDDPGEPVEREPVERVAGLVLEAAHHRLVQLALVREVPVDRALVDPRPLGDGPDGQLAPVPPVEAVDQVGPGDEDALARVRGLLAPHGAVVLAPLGRAHGGCDPTGGLVARGAEAGGQPSTPASAAWRTAFRIPW